MKNVLFALMFLFATSLGFANTTNSVYIDNQDRIEVKSDIMKIDVSKINDIDAYLKSLYLNEVDWGCVELYYNGEFIGYACGNTLGEIIDNILEMFF